MSKRPVSLDLRTLAGDGGALSGRRSSAFQAPDEFDQALAERFAAALQGPPPAPGESSAVERGGPFSLLGAVNKLDANEISVFERLGAGLDDEQHARTAGVPAHAPIIDGALTALEGEGAGQQDPRAGKYHPQLLQALTATAQSIAVSDGSQGRRAARIELSDSALPGVTVSVYLAYGEWVADFVCTVQSSFESLAIDASDMAQQLSDALQKPACWLVSMDPAECDPVEARALPARTPTE
jgi:hypothetical protein